MLAHVELGDIASHSGSGVRQRALAQLSAQRERYALACVDATIAADQGVFTAVMREMLARERAPVAASSQSNRLPRGDVSCAPPVKQMAVVSSVVELDEE
jgi:type II secretory pathway predicted ATPase ExeA